MIKWDQ